MILASAFFRSSSVRMGLSMITVQLGNRRVLVVYFVSSIKSLLFDLSNFWGKKIYSNFADFNFEGFANKENFWMYKICLIIQFLLRNINKLFLLNTIFKTSEFRNLFCPFIYNLIFIKLIRNWLTNLYCYIFLK